MGYKVGDLLKYRDGDIFRITSVGNMAYGIQRQSDGSYDTYDKTHIDSLYPLTMFKVGDVVSRNDNGRLYKIVSELTNGNFKMQSVTSGNYYDLTEHNNYTLFTEGRHEEQSSECNHEWKVYNSGFTIDNYCAKCNAKRAYEGTE